jgi:hypothetical protein
VRRGIVAFVALLVITVWAAPAGAGVVFADAAGGRARILHRWLEGLALPVPSARIVIHIAPCPGIPSADGCSAPGVIWLHHVDRSVLLHELGHQDDYVQPAWARAAFEAINDDRRPWGSEPNGPEEQFAEAWMGCAAPALAAERYDSATGRYEFAFGYRPSWSALQRACALIRRAVQRARG